MDLNFLLEVLVIFAGMPVSAPCKTVLYKKCIGRIIPVDLMGKRLFSVSIVFAPGRSDIDRTVAATGDIRIVKGIEIDCKPVSMVGKFSGRESTVIEAGGVIVLHGQGVVALIVVHQRYLFDGITGLI